MLEQCCGGAVLWWNSAVVEQCCGGTVLWWNSAVVEQCCGGAVLWWSTAALEQSCGRCAGAVQDLTVLAMRTTSLGWKLDREIDQP